MVKCDLAEFELTGLKTDKKENLHYILSLWSWREVDLLTESTTSINGTLKRGAIDKAGNGIRKNKNKQKTVSISLQF